MNSIYLDTLSLLSDSLHDRINTDISADKLPGIFKELEAHAVTSLVAKNVASLDLNSEDKFRFMQILGMSFQNYNFVILEQNKLLNSLQESGIKAVVLKGTSAAKYYLKPEYRSMGDIDVLVNPKDFDKACYVISSLGFNPDTEEGIYNRHQGFHNAYGLEIELHRYFSSVGTKEQRDFLDNRLLSGLVVSENSILPEVENGLVLIGHVAQHLKSGLGLRQIIDWLMYTESNLSDKFWAEKFSFPVKECGFDRLAKVTTAACRKYLGLNINITWCNDVDEDLVDTFIEYIMNQGNFGRKHEKAEKEAAVVFSNFRNPLALLKYLQAGGKTHSKLARTNKFFGCFAWIFQICHIIKMGFTKKVGIKNLKRINDESENIVRLMDELNIL